MNILVWVKDKLFGKPKVEAPVQPVVKNKPGIKKQPTTKTKKPTTKKIK